MITSVHIKALRGIAEAHVEGLTPLSLLVGRNGSGKSTLLEAMLIGAQSHPSEAVGRVVRQRTVKNGSRWLFHRGSESSASITLGFDEGPALQTELRLKTAFQIECIRSAGAATVMETVSFNPDNSYAASYPSSGGRRQVRWISPFAPNQAALHGVYSEAVQYGRRQVAKKILKAAIPGFDDIEILTEGDEPVVHVVFDSHSVPVAAMGDGTKALVRLCLELAARSDGVVLLEEPETHTHPALLLLAAKAILEATSRGIQVILSTHSLDLIDMLLAAGADTHSMSVFRCALDDGRVKTTRITGADLALARGELNEDLR